MNWPLLPLSIDWFFTVSVAAVFVFLNFFSLFNNQLHTTNKQILKMNSFCLICVTIFSQSRLFAYFLLLFWFILFLIRIRSVVTVHTMSNSTTQTHSGSLLTHSSSQFLAIISARHTFARTSRTNSKSIKQINKKKTKREFCVFCFILSLLGIHFCWLLLSLTTHYTGLSLKKIAFHLLAPVWRTKYYAVCRLYGNIKMKMLLHSSSVVCARTYIQSIQFAFRIYYIIYIYTLHTVPITHSMVYIQWNTLSFIYAVCILSKVCVHKPRIHANVRTFIVMYWESELRGGKCYTTTDHGQFSFSATVCD